MATKLAGATRSGARPQTVSWSARHSADRSAQSSPQRSRLIRDLLSIAYVGERSLQSYSIAVYLVEVLEILDGGGLAWLLVDT